MDTLAEAVRSGKVRAVGVSNYGADLMRRAHARLARHDIPLASNQVHYNLLHRKPEKNGVLDVCRELNVALIAYSPLEQGCYRQVQDCCRTRYFSLRPAALFTIVSCIPTSKDRAAFANDGWNRQRSW